MFGKETIQFRIQNDEALVLENKKINSTLTISQELSPWMFDFEIPFLPESESAHDELPLKEEPILSGIKVSKDFYSGTDETWSLQKIS